jgi:hypothetical protein
LGSKQPLWLGDVLSRLKQCWKQHKFVEKSWENDRTTIKQQEITRTMTKWWEKNYNCEKILRTTKGNEMPKEC